jgi:hypothetical protein
MTQPSPPADTPPGPPRPSATLNERIAVHATKVFGTMWAFYVLTLYGLLPLAFPNAQDRLLYWSNVIQLVALPLLMVGQNVLGRAAERQSRETHDAVLEDRQLLREELQLLRTERDQLAALTTALIPAPVKESI